MRKLIFIILMFPFLAHSQHYNFPLSFSSEIVVNKNINQTREIIHTGFKPIAKSYVYKHNNFENEFYFSNIAPILIHKFPIKWFWRKLLSEDFIKIEEHNFKLYINPLINYNVGHLKDSTQKYVNNTRGIEIHGELGQKLAFYTDFYENQTTFIPYIDRKIELSKVVPGQGAWKQFNQTGRDYAMASGYLSFVPTQHINIQFGTGKSKVGEGYRSLLLSDNSFAYPFLKLNFTYNKFQYIAMFTEFRDFKSKYYTYHFTKHATFNYLSYSPFHKLQFALFEGIIWKTSDRSTFVKHIPITYFLSLPIYRLFLYGLDNENNILLGLNLKYKIYKFSQFYGQFMIDNYNPKFKGDIYKKMGYQMGIKFFDLLHGYFNNQFIYLQAEYNRVCPQTYTNDDPFQSYSHYNQELAYPLGADFSEKIAIIKYEFFNFSLEYKINYIKTSYDTIGINTGNNIFLSNQTITSHNDAYIKATIKHQDITFAYVFNQRTYLQLFVSLSRRNYVNKLFTENTNFLFFGVKTSLNNYYYDF